VLRKVNLVSYEITFREIILTTPNKIFVLFDRVATYFVLEKKNSIRKNQDVTILPFE
jgi:hypothetical protein